MPKTDQKVIVISFDAMVREDIRDTLSQYPNFRYVIEHGSEVETMRTVYPSITYPVHASIMTGTTVGKHGVIGNELEMFGVKGFHPWRWERKYVSPETPTVFDYAHDAGYTTAACFWPVTGNDPHIDYLIPEVWDYQGDQNVFGCDVLRKYGTQPAVNERICRVHEHYLYEDPEDMPPCDSFLTACSRDLINLFKPDVLFIHFGLIDAYRHKFGVFSQELTDKLIWMDRFLGVLMETAREAGVFDKTNFILMSDHGQMDIEKVVCINRLLIDAGFIRVNAKDNVVSWDAFERSNAQSCAIFLKDPTDKDLYDRVYSALTEWAKNPAYGIQRIYTAEECKAEEGYYGDFSFVLESDGKTSFANHWNPPVVHNPSSGDYTLNKATHGYQPDCGPQPPFLACGPAFKQGVHLDRRSVLDVAPTVAKILGFDMPTAEGKVLTELLK